MWRRSQTSRASRASMTPASSSTTRMRPAFSGERGSGLSGDADIVIGTFSKALGGFGGYVASTETMRDYLDQSLWRHHLLDGASAAGARRHRRRARSRARHG